MTLLTQLRIASTLRTHPWISASGVLAIVCAAALAAVLAPGNQNPSAFDPRTRVYSDRSACLLTDAHGTTSTDAAAAWAGMQQATDATSERNSTLPITGAQTLQGAETYLNTLALRGCQVIVGAGALPNQAIQAQAAAFPHIRFIAVTTGEPASQKPANLTMAPESTPSTITHAVATALIADAAQPSP